MKIKDLPESITVNLDEENGIQYPKDGEFETTFQVELLCFNKKQFLKTWPLRQRVMAMIAHMGKNLDGMIDESQREAAKQEEETTLDAETMQQMCLMGGFDAIAAMEEFKQFAVSGNLIKLDDNIFLNKQRWEDGVDDEVKEALLFAYLANFIQPCVLDQSKAKK